MMAETPMDRLVQRLAAFNQLLDVRPADQQDDDDVAANRKKSGGKKDGQQGGGFFGTVVGEIVFRRNGTPRPGILGISHPSDGHPQEELTPDFAWFRPLAYNNATWTLYWPELII